MPKICEILISEWWPGDSVCLPLTPRVLHSLGAGWPYWFNSQGKQQQRARATVSATAVESGDVEHLSHNSRQRQSKIDAQAAEIAQMKTELKQSSSGKINSSKICSAKIIWSRP